MKNKKLLLMASLVFALSAEKTFAQGAYVNVGAGYGMSLASTSFGENATYPASSPSTHEGVKGSLGKGLNLGAGFGFMFNENVGAELGLNYLMGGKIESTTTDNRLTPATVYKVSQKATMLRIIPSVVVSVGDGGAKPYAKVGLVLGMAGKITDDYNRTQGSNVTVETEEYTGGMAMGFASAFGVKIGTGKMSFFAELGIIAQSWAPTKSVRTKYTIDGVDQLIGKPTSYMETNYVDSYTEPTTINTGSPKEKIKTYNPMSSVGVNVGLNISFGK